jgi:hypothetical protein
LHQSPMNGTHYGAIVAIQCEHGMALPEWRRCRGDPWKFSRGRLREDMRRASTSDDSTDDWSPLLKAAAQLAWRDGDDASNQTP